MSCEACHGASSPWIGPHSRGVYQYDEVLAAGLFATADPSARAGMCARCHGPDGGVRHTLLAAGHPRLDFDLASFSRLQPAHYVVDSDYRQRKHPPTEAAIWAIGASTTVSARFRALGDPARSAALFPEFSLLSCGGCHVPLHENVRPAMAPNWRPREILDLSEIPALRAVALATSPALAAEIDGRVQTLKASISRRAVFAAAALDLATVTDRLAVSLKTTNLSGAQALVALQSLPDATAMAANPAAAESALRAIAALARTSLESGVASPADARHLLAQLESLSTLRGGDPPLQAADRAGLRAALVRAAGQTEMIR